jgi:hypothetical protein
LEDLIDPQIEEMLAASIPPEHRYSLSNIPDADGAERGA